MGVYKGVLLSDIPYRENIEIVELESQTAHAGTCFAGRRITKLPARSRKQKPESRKQEAGNRKQEKRTKNCKKRKFTKGVLVRALEAKPGWIQVFFP